MTLSKPELLDDFATDDAHCAKRAAEAVRRVSSSALLPTGKWLARLTSVVAVSAVLLATCSVTNHFSGVKAALLVGFVASVVLVLWGVSVENRAALFFATLFGVPLNGPKFTGGRDTILGERARWLARFLREPPRGLNTVGAHLACGVIAVKRELKAICVREERRQQRLRAAQRERKALLEARREVSQRAARLLAAGHRGARACSRRAHRLSSNIESLDAHIFQLRLDIQRGVVAEFMNRWQALHDAGEVSGKHHQEVAEQLRQPEGEPEALLPNGLVPSTTAYFFEYGMFFGRAALAAAFIATFDTSSMAWSIVLLLLSLYVIEPVVQKLYLSGFNLLLESPGHKLLDLKRHLDTNVPAGQVFRVPITVPKFSSNPARSNLQAIIDTALARSGITPVKIVPFAARDGILDTVIEFGDGEKPERLEATKTALASELARNVARFPLATRVTLAGSRITIHLLDELAKVWDLVGEDANQAFTYLKRNMEGLKDSIAYLGPKFQPVFVFVSNTKDPDVVQYELDHVLELQRRSDREFSGQLGFLYLLRGGAWYNFNARLDYFDANDKDFVRAVPEFLRRLAEGDEFPARSYLLQLLADGRSARDLARAFNHALRDRRFHEQFSGFDFDSLPPELRPTQDTRALLAHVRAGLPLDDERRRDLNRELLLSALPARINGDFFKKVGNDIAVHELIVAGKTRPTVYLDRGRGEHVQDPNLPNFVRAEGDFARYTGLEGSNEQIRSAILRGLDIHVSEVPEVGAIIDDKNEFGPGELEKGIAIMLHPENRHIVIGVPRINVTLPEHNGSTMASDFILGAGSARDCHNAADSRSKACVFGFSSVAYGKWLHRPRPYLAHYAREVLNPAHALSHDFQQSYFVAGAAGRLGGFSEALYGPTRLHAETQPSRELAWADNEKLRLLGWRALRNQALAYARSQQAFLATGASRGST
ncbi:MAG TPA: hypothetical protein VER11_01350 [Polyangiaceae bacterium]|nr:hypothetical protein [Polyangiaceae bacterium]